MEVSSWFRQIFATYEGRLIRYTYKIVGNKESSKDIVQDCFLKLLKKNQSEVEHKIPPWLYIVCRNAAIDELRKNKKNVSDEGMDFQIDSNYEDEFVKKEIIKCIKKLSPKHQEALVLKFQEGMSYKEMSSVMKTTESYVGVLIHEGIKFLREEMGGRHD